MTYREVELFIEGQDEARQWQLEALAWMSANLMNIHIPRGKPKVRADQLLPKRRSKSKAGDVEDREAADRMEVALGALSETPIDARGRVEAAKVRARQKREAEEWAEFNRTSGGKRIAEIFADEE